MGMHVTATVLLKDGTTLQFDKVKQTTDMLLRFNDEYLMTNMTLWRQRGNVLFAEVVEYEKLTLDVEKN